MARPRTPIAVLKAKGTYRPDRHAGRANELALPTCDIGPAPKWFGVDARNEWNLLSTHPHYSKVLNPIHHGCLLEYCHLYGKMIATAKGKAKGAEAISGTERQTLHSLRMQLGITPASQSKIKMPEPKPAESKWAATMPTPTSKPA